MCVVHHCVHCIQHSIKMLIINVKFKIIIPLSLFCILLKMCTLYTILQKVLQLIMKQNLLMYSEKLMLSVDIHWVSFCIAYSINNKYSTNVHIPFVKFSSIRTR